MADRPPSSIDGQILKRQTTYLELRDTRTGTVYRVSFDHKQEFLLDELLFKGCEIEETHPLLEQYEQEEVTIYLSSAPSNAEMALSEIARSLRNHFKGWRGLGNYGNPGYTAAGILKGGKGMLYRGPKAGAELVKGVLEKHGALFTSQEGRLPADKFKVLLLGSNYVVAKDFQFRKLGG